MSWDRAINAREDAEELEGLAGQNPISQDGESAPLQLKSKGQIWEMKSSYASRREADGLVRSMKNFPMRGHHWKFTTSCSNYSTGDFAVADDHGQVYLIDHHSNSYKLVRGASTSISAMSFLPCKDNHLIVAYESGAVVVVDTASCSCLSPMGDCSTTSCSTKETVGSIQSDASGMAPVRSIRCHPTKPFAILVSDDMVVSIWNMRSMRCIRTIECDEPVLDVEYELNGAVLLLALRYTGIYIYRARDFALLKHCPLPAAERQPQWTAYSSHVLKPQRSKHFDKQANKTVVRYIGHPHIRCMLIGDNGAAYIWDAEIPSSHTANDDGSPSKAGSGEESAALSMDNDEADQLEYDDEGQVVPKDAPLLGVMDFPVRFEKVVTMLNIPLKKVFANRNARFCVMDTSGSVSIVEVTEASFASIGTWAIVADFSPTTLQGVAHAGYMCNLVGSSASEEDKLANESKEFQQFVQQRAISNLNPVSSSTAATAAAPAPADGQGALGLPRLQPIMNYRGGPKSAALRARYGLVSAHGDMLLTVGVDGMSRLFDLDAALGLGQLAGSALVTREPYRHNKRPALSRTMHEHSYTAPELTKGKQGPTLSEQQLALKAVYEARASKRTAAAAAAAALKDPSSSNAGGKGEVKDKEDKKAETQPRQRQPRFAVQAGDGEDEEEEEEEEEEVKTCAEDSKSSRTSASSRSSQSASASSKEEAVAVRKGVSVSSGSSSSSSGIASNSSSSSSSSSSETLKSALKSGSSSSKTSVTVPSSSSSSSSSATSRSETDGDGDEGENRKDPRKTAEVPASLTIEELRQERLKRDREINAVKRAKEEQKLARRAERALESEKRRQSRALRREAVMTDGISKRAMAMFELKQLTPEERVNNRRKLVSFLESHGEFPTRYRPLIWRFLLELPENVDAFDYLVKISAVTANKSGTADSAAQTLRIKLGDNPVPSAKDGAGTGAGVVNEELNSLTNSNAMAFADLEDKYPLKDKTVLQRLRSGCTMLAHWCPVLVEAEWLPQFVFPLVAVYGSDDMSIVETAVSIFMWWGHTWFTGYPDAPKHISDAIDTLLGIHDKRLKFHLDNLSNSRASNASNVGFGGKLGWSLMSTLAARSGGSAQRICWPAACPCVPGPWRA